MSKLDSIRISLGQYGAALTEYGAIMEDVESGKLSLGSLSDADELRGDAAGDFADDAFEFLSLILPHIDRLRIVAASKLTDLRDLEAAAHGLINAVTAPSQGGTEEEGSRA